MRPEFKRHLIEEKGQSLAEVMVTILIFSMLSVGIAATLAVGDSSWNNNNVAIELQQNTRKAVEWMKYDLHQAGDDSIVGVPANGTGYTSITFQIPSGVAGGSIVWNVNTIQFILGGVDSNQLQKIVRDELGTVLSTQVLANNIISLQFLRQVSSSNILEVAMVARKQVIKGTTMNYPLNFQVELRN